ncbi:MAG: hypothetical protein ACNI3A_18555 [Desulfovibrio sp.]|uniref:hypothetical protein n=1 Tax=Desulfovibrio sp. 7SRBS1 TaxID=3378064 RepID=UPI003B3F7C3D
MHEIQAVNEHYLNLRVRRRSTSYFDEFLRLECSRDLLKYKLYPKAKEVTESFAAFHAVRNHLFPDSMHDPNITMVAVGDGYTPRTAATFAYRSKWLCHSVDPVMDTREFDIDRLVVHRKRIEDVRIQGDIVVVVCVHAHVEPEVIAESIEARERHWVVIPCCDHDHDTLMGQAPYCEYDDFAIWSPKHRVQVWKNI